ncbi:MAG: hypothetical protein RRY13_02330 [Akkermansia sp.]
MSNHHHPHRQENGAGKSISVLHWASVILPRPVVMAILMGVAIVLCALFRQMYNSMEWDDMSLLGAPFYTMKHAVAVGFFSAAVWGVCLSAGGIFWMLLSRVVGAHWSGGVRRMWENIGVAGMSAWLCLFCVVGCMMSLLFPWADVMRQLMPETMWQWDDETRVSVLMSHGLDVLAGRSWFVNMPFFFLREFSYAAILLIVAISWRKVSIKMDVERDSSRRSLSEKRIRTGSALVLPLVVVIIGMMGIDWAATCAQDWIPSMFPLAFLSYCAVLGLAASILLSGCFVSRCHESLTGFEHGRLGGLLLAALMFKVYLWYSQYMLIWYAGIPVEGAFYAIRMSGDWLFIAQFCTWGNLVLLVSLLLPKVRHSRHLMTIVALGLVLLGGLEAYWMLGPVMRVIQPFGVSGVVLVASILVVASLMGVQLFSLMGKNRIYALNAHQELSTRGGDQNGY